MLRRLLIPAALAIALIVPASAHATTVTATGRGVTAAFAYEGSLPDYHDQRLTITGAGRTLYSGAVTDPSCGDHCWPELGTRQKPVQIADLDGSGSADVLLNLFTGGAHCCSVVQVFRPSAALGGRYVRSARYDFGDPGYTLKSLDGQPRFVTADDTFAYAFTDFAASGLPVQVLRLNGVKWEIVTSRYSALVRRDAARWLRAFHSQARSGYQDSIGLFAAWVADEANLGPAHYRAAIAYARAQASAGHLNSALNPSAGGSRFITKLERLLRREGYTV